jgi:hypothetical protein
LYDSQANKTHAANQSDKGSDQKGNKTWNWNAMLSTASAVELLKEMKRREQLNRENKSLLLGVERQYNINRSAPASTQNPTL